MDAHSPRAHARPGDRDTLGWAGIRAHGRLVAAGAIVRSPAGHPHLRGITVADGQHGRGLGGSVSAFLTRAGLRRSSAVSLSVYSENLAARSLYERLAYRTYARFASFEVGSD